MAPANKRRVGDELRSRRESLGLTLHNVEVATKIRGHYLRAIETSDFTHLPNDIYSRGFVRQYADYLGLSGQDIVKRYKQERGVQFTPQPVKPRPLELRFGVTSNWAISLLVLGALATIIGYLLWQFSSLTAAPKLRLSSPIRDGVVNEAIIEVKGQTAPGADVYLNDVLLPSDVNGNFSTQLSLQPGVNELRVMAKNKLGKQTLITRNILSKQSAVNVLPAVSFDGVAVMLMAREASSVKIVADDKVVYEGSMAKGSGRLFTAANKLTVATSNASALSAKLTNSVVAGYDFGTLGQEATARIVDFYKTTKVLQ